MNRNRYILLSLCSLVALSSCQSEEENAPVSEIEATVYEGGRDLTFTDEELDFWSSSERYDKSTTTARRGVNHRTTAGEASDNATQIEYFNATWYLSEGYAYSADGQPEGAEFVPMAPITTNIDAFVRTVQGYIESGYVNRVAGFNPNDSSSLTAADAIAGWAALEYLEVPLLSPVANLIDTSWFEEFLALASAEGIRMNYLAVEYEGSIIEAGSGALLLADLQSKLDAFELMIDTYYPAYSELPVILTGVSTPDEVGGVYTEDGLKDEIQKFMIDAQTWLEDETPSTYIKAYAWHTYNKRALPATLISASSKMQQLGYVFYIDGFVVDWSLDIPEVEYDNLIENGDFESGSTSGWDGGNGFTYIAYSTAETSYTANLFMSGGGTGMVLLNLATGNGSKNIYQNNIMLKPNYKYAMGFTGRVHSEEGSESGENEVSSDGYYVTLNLRPSSNSGSSYSTNGQDLWTNYGKGITSCEDTNFYHEFNTSAWSTDTYLNANNEIYTRLIVAKLDNGEYCAYVDNVYLYELGEYTKPVNDDAVDVEGNMLLDGTFEDAEAFASRSKWTIYNGASFISYDDDTIDLFMDNGGNGMALISEYSTANIAQEVTIEYGKKYKFGFTGRIHSKAGSKSGENEITTAITTGLTVNLRAGGTGVGMEYTDHKQVISSCTDTNLEVEIDTTENDWSKYQDANGNITLRVIIVKPTGNSNFAYVDNAYLIDITE